MDKGLTGNEANVVRSSQGTRRMDEGPHVAVRRVHVALTEDLIRKWRRRAQQPSFQPFLSWRSRPPSHADLVSQSHRWKQQHLMTPPDAPRPLGESPNDAQLSASFRAASFFTVCLTAPTRASPCAPVVPSSLVACVSSSLPAPIRNWPLSA